MPGQGGRDHGCLLPRRRSRHESNDAGPSLPSSYPYSFPCFFLFTRRRVSQLKSTRQSPLPNAIGCPVPPPGYRAFTYVPIGSSTPSPVPARPAIFRSRDARPQQRRECQPLVLLDERSAADLANLLFPQPTRLFDEPFVNGSTRRGVPSHSAKAAALNCQGSALEPPGSALEPPRLPPWNCQGSAFEPAGCRLATAKAPPLNRQGCHLGTGKAAALHRRPGCHGSTTTATPGYRTGIARHDSWLNRDFAHDEPAQHPIRERLDRDGYQLLTLPGYGPWLLLGFAGISHRSQPG
jgi:hypothetical protein